MKKMLQTENLIFEYEKRDEEGNVIVEARHAMQSIYLPIEKVKEYSILRKKNF